MSAASVHEDRRITWGMGDAVAGTLAALVASAVVASIAFAVAGVKADETDEIALWAVALLQVPLWAGLAGSSLWASRRKGLGSLAADFGLRMEWRDVPIGVGVGLASQLVLGLLLLPVYQLLGIDRDEVGRTAQKLADRVHDPVAVVCLLLVAVVGAALFEELFYRGLWLRSIERRFGTPAAVAGSAVIFGLMHFQAADTIALVGFGAVAAFLTVRSGRLGPSIWAHVAFNLTAVVALLRS